MPVGHVFCNCVSYAFVCYEFYVNLGLDDVVAEQRIERVHAIGLTS